MSSTIETRKRYAPPSSNEAILNQDFYILPESKASNQLMKTLPERITNQAQLDLYGNGQIISKDKDFKLFINGYNEIKRIQQTAVMLLDSLLIKATQQGLKDTLVRLPLKEYMGMRGLRDEKETRKQVKRDINALERIRFEYRGTGKQKKDWFNVTLYGGEGITGIVRGNIVFSFSTAYFKNLWFNDAGKYLYMYFPRVLLMVNTKDHPYSYALGRKVTEHKRMNVGKLNEDVISVQTLIEVCPNLPTYDEVMAGDRAIERRIIEPFERDMNALELILSWKYVLADDQEPPHDYISFIGAKIEISWSGYPSMARLEARKQKKAQRTAKTNTDRRKINALEERISQLEEKADKS
jgi:hypothetical protein